MTQTKTFWLIIMMIITNFIWAQQPGDLDITFSGDGKLSADFGDDYERIRSLKIQPDGKIIVAGDNFIVVRYNPDGSLDSTFNSNGIIQRSTEWSPQLSIQSDGKIVILSVNVDNKIHLIRYHSNGVLDNTFGTNGIAETPLNINLPDAFYPTSLMIQSDGKFVAVGFSYIGSVFTSYAIRFNSDGSLDNSFNGDGIASYDWGILAWDYFCGAIDSNNRVLIGGQENGHGLVMRYTTDGNLDTSFDGDGILRTSFSGIPGEGCLSIAVQTDGKIIISGSAFDGNGNSIFLVARYYSDGTLDTGFDSDGLVTIDFNNSTYEQAWSVKLQSDGKILVGGGTGDFVLVRMNSNGSMDNSFGINGISVIANVGTYAYTMEIQPDGKIVLAGQSSGPTNYNYAIARYLSGLNVGILDCNLTQNSIFVYPNPVLREINLEYELMEPQIITIQLLNIQGEVLKTFVDEHKQELGKHKESLVLPERLVAGIYFLDILSQSGRINLKIIKE